MSYSVKRAAEAVGRTKPSILRAIQKGKISATKDVHGEWTIDPAELHRVYPPVAVHSDARTDDGEPLPNGVQVREITLLRERIADQAETIADLRRRLDQAEEERRQTAAALLADRRAPSLRRRWWHFGHPE